MKQTFFEDYSSEVRKIYVSISPTYTLIYIWAPMCQI